MTSLCLILLSHPVTYKLITSTQSNTAPSTTRPISPDAPAATSNDMAASNTQMALVQWKALSVRSENPGAWLMVESRVCCLRHWASWVCSSSSMARHSFCRAALEQRPTGCDGSIYRGRGIEMNRMNQFDNMKQISIELILSILRFVSKASWDHGSNFTEAIILLCPFEGLPWCPQIWIYLWYS